MRHEQQGQSEQKIVQAAQEGDLDSFAILYNRYHSPMVALGFSMLGDRDMADDAAGEAFAIACRDLSRLKSQEKFAAWLAGICRNVARQMLRATRAGEVVRTGGETTLKQDETEARRGAIRRAVAKLRGPERELIVLRYFDGFSQARISEVLGVSPQAVNSRLVRAKRKIAEYLKNDGFAGDSHETA
ncbi:MAG: sigma-70 family RNA polymerase sigma factor [Sedimentisphaerales bacterium]|nr:sigma-70 family RNA polymerase sigma factor [Sedimentisphaerales bacterium]